MGNRQTRRQSKSSRRSSGEMSEAKMSEPEGSESSEPLEASTETIVLGLG